jgi:hypothetical protein
LNILIVRRSRLVRVRLERHAVDMAMYNRLSIDQQADSAAEITENVALKRSAPPPFKRCALRVPDLDQAGLVARSFSRKARGRVRRRGLQAKRADVEQSHRD